MSLPMTESYRRPGCFGKVDFTSYEKAARRAKQWGQRVYRCPLCRYYHTTSAPLTRERGRKEADDYARRWLKGTDPQPDSTEE